MRRLGGHGQIGISQICQWSWTRHLGVDAIRSDCNSFKVRANYLFKNTTIALMVSKVKVKCHQNLVTSSEHYNTHVFLPSYINF